MMPADPATVIGRTTLSQARAVPNDLFGHQRHADRIQARRRPIHNHTSAGCNHPGERGSSAILIDRLAERGERKLDRQHGSGIMGVENRVDFDQVEADQVS